MHHLKNKTLRHVYRMHPHAEVAGKQQQEATVGCVRWWFHCVVELWNGKTETNSLTERR